MSRLDELIAKLCPDGIDFFELSEISFIEKGVQFNKSNMYEKGSYPVINGGINPSGYIEQYNQEENTITVSQGGASAGFVNWLNTKFWAGAHCYIIKPKKQVLNRYLYHFIKLKEYKLQECQYGAGIPALAKSTLEKLKVPVPPIEVQKEIVRILDNFTNLTAELTAELTARQKQYEFYRNTLLMQNYNMRKIKLSNVATYSKDRISATEIDAETYVGVDNLLQNKKGKVKATYVPKAGNLLAYNAGDILIGNIRPYLRKIWLADSKGGTNGDVLVIRTTDKNVLNRFLYYVLSDERFFLYDNNNAKGAKMPRGDKNAVMEYEFYLPNLETQKRIVDVLDNFEKICNDLNIGLPAEIEARQKQYEYYRDLLLTFAENGSIILTDRQTDRQT